LGGVEQPRRNPARSSVVGSVVARGRKGKSGEEMGFGSSFIGGRCSVEERERESRHRARLRSTGGADVPFGCAWRPLGTSGPTWQDEGRPAEAARAVGAAARRHVGREEGCAGLQQAREAADGGGSRVRGRDRGDRGERGRRRRTRLKILERTGTLL
jgi:hypothetical protein